MTKTISSFCWILLGFQLGSAMAMKQDKFTTHARSNLVSRRCITHPLTSSQPQRSFIDVQRNFNASAFDTNVMMDRNEYGVIEIFVVMDRGLSNIFHQDKNIIYEYLTTFFHDINLRFSSLQIVKLRIRVTGIHIISDDRDQRIIDSAKIGKRFVSSFRVLKNFNGWLVKHANVMPKFDVAVLLTNSIFENHVVGKATVEGACSLGHNGVIVHDRGTWEGLVTAAHEIGHAVGADDDLRYSSEKCTFETQIMTSVASSEDENQPSMLAFSECSDKMISKFVNSGYGKCIKNIDHKGRLPIRQE